MSVARIEVVVELPEPLVAMFQGHGGDPCQLLGDALRRGLSEEARPAQIPTAEINDPGARRRHAATNLLHFFGRYWYLAVTVSRLQAAVDRLEQQLELMAGPDLAADAIEQAKQAFAPPPLVQTAACVEQASLDEAGHLFVRDATSDPPVTAIAFGAGLVLLEHFFAHGSPEELQREISRYWAGVATFQYRAYVLGHDRQVLEFRLAALRAQARLKERHDPDRAAEP